MRLVLAVAGERHETLGEKIDKEDWTTVSVRTYSTLHASFDAIALLFCVYTRTICTVRALLSVNKLNTFFLIYFISSH